MWLRDSGNLATNTINYRSAVGQVLNIVYGLDKAWEFKALKCAQYLEKPPNPPRVPLWDVNKVLLLLKSSKYNQCPPDSFCQLKKTLFLTALATGNRISELANTVRTGLDNLQTFQRVGLGVLPGFLFKNQRLNRSLPNIEIAQLETGPIELCPVHNLATYLKGSPPSRGKLFVNSRTNKPLHSSSILNLFCELI